jgi:hypothetical protein
VVFEKKRPEESKVECALLPAQTAHQGLPALLSWLLAMAIMVQKSVLKE